MKVKGGRGEHWLNMGSGRKPHILQILSFIFSRHASITV